MDKVPLSAVVKSVVWITSLREQEQGVTRRIVEDLQPFLESKRIAFTCIELKSADDFRKLMQELETSAKLGAFPLLHFDVHGDIDAGMRIAATGEDISWVEVANLLRPINIATRNNLIVMLLACFGFHVLQNFEFDQPVPCYFIAAAPKQVEAGFIEAETMEFYRLLFGGRDIMGAFIPTLGKKLAYQWCEQWCFTVLTRFIFKESKAKAVQESTERLVSKLMASGPVGRWTLRNARRYVKNQYRTMTKQDMLKYVKKYMIGRPVAFTMEHVEAAVQRMRETS